MEVMNRVGAEPTSRVLLVVQPVSAWGLERLIETATPDLALAGTIHSLDDGVLAVGTLKPDLVLVDMDGEPRHDVLSNFYVATQANMLVLTSSPSSSWQSQTIKAGARGVICKSESPSLLLKAMRKVSCGEVWLDRTTTGRLFMEIAHQRLDLEKNQETERIKLLTPRERLTVIALGSDAKASGKTIAHRLHISENTLRKHLTSIFAKLSVNNRLELFVFAQRNGLLA